MEPILRCKVDSRWAGQGIFQDIFWNPQLIAVTDNHPSMNSNLSHFSPAANRMIYPFMLSLTDAQIFHNSRSHLIGLVTRRVTWSKFHTEDPKILGAMPTWHPGFVHPWSILKLSCHYVEVSYTVPSFHIFQLKYCNMNFEIWN
jgi:hypothetical protein